MGLCQKILSTQMCPLFRCPLFSYVFPQFYIHRRRHGHDIEWPFKPFHPTQYSEDPNSGNLNKAAT